MQGHLSEIDIRSIFQLIELGQRTGELCVESYSPQPQFNRSDRPQRLPPQCWFVFFANGKIIYAGSDTDSSLVRLRHHLHRYGVASALDLLKVPTIAATNAPEYGYLWAMLENHSLTPAQGRSIIKSMVQETLFDLFSLHNGSFMFELGPPIAPQLTPLEIGPLVTKVLKQVQQWNQLHPQIQSPDQCPVLCDAAELSQHLNEKRFKILASWANKQTSIRQISRYLNGDILTVAKAIYPFVQKGWVQLSYLSSPEPDWIPEDLKPMRPPRVVFIDDGVALCKAVEQILQASGYEVAGITNPLRALSLVFQLKPDLILCDIAMPELDGYEICAMLRRSNRFRQTPIVMLTGRDGFIDRLKARMIGATDYLTKPFGQGELLMVLEKYIGKGGKTDPSPDRILDDAIASELDLEPLTPPSGDLANS